MEESGMEEGTELQTRFQRLIADTETAEYQSMLERPSFAFSNFDHFMATTAAETDTGSDNQKGIEEINTFFEDILNSDSDTTTETDSYDEQSDDNGEEQMEIDEDTRPTKAHSQMNMTQFALRASLSESDGEEEEELITGVSDMNLNDNPPDLMSPNPPVRPANIDPTARTPYHPRIQNKKQKEPSIEEKQQQDDVEGEVEITESRREAILQGTITVSELRTFLRQRKIPFMLKARKAVLLEKARSVLNENDEIEVEESSDEQHQQHQQHHDIILQTPAKQSTKSRRFTRSALKKGPHSQQDQVISPIYSQTPQKQVVIDTSKTPMSARRAKKMQKLNQQRSSSSSSASSSSNKQSPPTLKPFARSNMTGGRANNGRDSMDTNHDSIITNHVPIPAVASLQPGQISRMSIASVDSNASSTIAGRMRRSGRPLIKPHQTLSSSTATSASLPSTRTRTRTSSSSSYGRNTKQAPRLIPSRQRNRSRRRFEEEEDDNEEKEMSEPQEDEYDDESGDNRTQRLLARRRSSKVSVPSVYSPPAVRDRDGDTIISISETPIRGTSTAKSDRLREEYEREEAIRRQREEEEAEKKRQKEAERKREQEAERKRQKAEEEAERKRQRDAEIRREEEEAERKRQQAEEEAERKRQKEAERKRQQAEEEAERRREQEAERKRQKAEEEAARRRQREEKEAEKKRQREAERRRQQEEEEAKRKQKEEEEEEEEQERRREEEQRRKDEQERIRKEQKNKKQKQQQQQQRKHVPFTPAPPMGLDVYTQMTNPNGLTRSQPLSDSPLLLDDVHLSLEEEQVQDRGRVQTKRDSNRKERIMTRSRSRGRSLSVSDSQISIEQPELDILSPITSSPSTSASNRDKRQKRRSSVSSTSTRTSNRMGPNPRIHVSENPDIGEVTPARNGAPNPSAITSMNPEITDEDLSTTLSVRTEGQNPSVINQPNPTGRHSIEPSQRSQKSKNQQKSSKRQKKQTKQQQKQQQRQRKHDNDDHEEEEEDMDIDNSDGNKSIIPSLGKQVSIHSDDNSSDNEEEIIQRQNKHRKGEAMSTSAVSYTPLGRHDSIDDEASSDEDEHAHAHEQQVRRQSHATPSHDDTMDILNGLDDLPAQTPVSKPAKHRTRMSVDTPLQTMKTPAKFGSPLRISIEQESITVPELRRFLRTYGTKFTKNDRKAILLEKARAVLNGEDVYGMHKSPLPKSPKSRKSSSNMNKKQQKPVSRTTNNKKRPSTATTTATTIERDLSHYDEQEQGDSTMMEMNEQSNNNMMDMDMDIDMAMSSDESPESPLKQPPSKQPKKQQTKPKPKPKPKAKPASEEPERRTRRTRSGRATKPVSSWDAPPVYKKRVPPPEIVNARKRKPVLPKNDKPQTPQKKQPKKRRLRHEIDFDRPQDYSKKLIGDMTMIDFCPTFDYALTLGVNEEIRREFGVDVIVTSKAEVDGSMPRVVNGFIRIPPGKKWKEGIISQPFATHRVVLCPKHKSCRGGNQNPQVSLTVFTEKVTKQHPGYSSKINILKSDMKVGYTVKISYKQGYKLYNHGKSDVLIAFEIDNVLTGSHLCPEGCNAYMSFMPRCPQCNGGPNMPE